MITNGCTYCEASGWLCDECHVERSIGDLMAEACYSAAAAMNELAITLSKMSRIEIIEFGAGFQNPPKGSIAIVQTRHVKKGKFIILPNQQVRRLIRKLQKRKQ